jgi:NTP pyrophosphatase (non-canonical NTP hydrolase)
VIGDHFNDLTPSQAERLAMIAEECAEVIQVVGKTLRHRHDSYHPADPQAVPNHRLLESELLDLFAVHLAMIRAGDIRSPGDLEKSAADRWKKKLRYAHHQEKSQ